MVIYFEEWKFSCGLLIFFTISIFIQFPHTPRVFFWVGIIFFTLFLGSIYEIMKWIGRKIKKRKKKKSKKK